MNRETPVAYDYEAKGAQDFAAGRKDDRLYANPENHGASYRRGWQQARRDAEARQDPPLTPGTTPQAIAARVADDQNLAEETHRPEEWNASPGSVSIVQPVEPPPVTREQVRLQTGEDKPKKPKPSNPDQLAFF